MTSGDWSVVGLAGFLLVAGALVLAPREPTYTRVGRLEPAARGRLPGLRRPVAAGAMAGLGIAGLAVARPAAPGTVALLAALLVVMAAAAIALPLLISEGRAREAGMAPRWIALRDRLGSRRLVVGWALVAIGLVVAAAVWTVLAR